MNAEGRNGYGFNKSQNRIFLKDIKIFNNSFNCINRYRFTASKLTFPIPNRFVLETYPIAFSSTKNHPS